jgi:hypothetical protein
MVGLAFTSHTLFLQNRYGTIDLNVVKDWVLEYPMDARQSSGDADYRNDSRSGPNRTPRDDTRYVNRLPIFGVRENGGSAPSTA